MTPEGDSLPQSAQIGVGVEPVDNKAAPGEKSVYVINIENRGEEARAQSVAIQGLPEQWYALEFDQRRVSFPREQRTATLVVSVPVEAEPSRLPFQVTVRSGSDESAVSCSLKVLARAGASATAKEEQAEEELLDTQLPPPGLSLSPKLLVWEGDPEEEERVIVTVRNSDVSDREYAVAVEGLRAGWYTLPPKIRVRAGSAMDAELRIHPPARARVGDYPFKVKVAVDDRAEVATEEQGRLTITPPTRVERQPQPREEEKPKAPASRAPTPPEASLAPRTTFNFGPGEILANAVLTVQNKSNLIEHFAIQVVGIPDEWYSLPVPEVRLDAGARQEVPLRLIPRVGPGRPAGEYPFRIRVSPHRFPDSFAEVGGLITITAVPAFDARFAPTQALGRKEKFKLTLRNTGAVSLNLILEGSDPEGMCKFQFPPPPNLEPGDEVVVPVLVGARRNGLLGPPETFDFRVRSTPAGGESSTAKSFDARFVHQPFLSHRFAFLSLFVAFLVAIVGVIIILGTPKIADGFTWVGCQMDDDYQKVKGGPVYIKEECGGAPAEVQERSFSGAAASPTPETNSPAPSPTGGATPVGGECVSSVGVKVGDQVDAVERLRIREEAGTDKAIIKTLEKDEIATLLEGPQCASNLVWWKVKLDGLEGWAAEKDGGAPLLQPRTP